MPMQWVEPEVFLEHAGHTIYHIYKDDQFDDGPRMFWYGTTIYASDSNTEDSFDVRDLANPNGWDVHTSIGREAIICDAIDRNDPPFNLPDDQA